MFLATSLKELCSVFGHSKRTEFLLTWSFIYNQERVAMVTPMKQAK